MSSEPDASNLPRDWEEALFGQTPPAFKGSA